MDILLETSKGYVAIELKNGVGWVNKFNRGMHRLAEEFGRNKVKCIGVFRGERQLMMDSVMVYPALDFLRRLWDGEIIQD